MTRVLIRQIFRTGIGFMLLSVMVGSSYAQFDDTLFRSALKIKKNVYISDGAFTGGERKHADFRVKNVRVASNPAGYDRLVVDFAGNDLGEASPLSRPPYYHVDVDALNKRVLITIYGKPKLDFSTQTAIQSAKKTKSIQTLQFLPILHDDRWIFLIESSKSIKVEAFDLSDPARLIIDVRT